MKQLITNTSERDLFIHPDDPNLRVYHSKDLGKTWDSGHPFMQWPKLVAIPDGPPD